MSDVDPSSVAAEDWTKGLKFCVIAFCWLDSTVSTAELPPVDALAEPPELEVEVEVEVELDPPQAASAATAASAQTAAPSLSYGIRRFMERAHLSDTNSVSICGRPTAGHAGPGRTASRLMRPRVRPGAQGFLSPAGPRREGPDTRLVRGHVVAGAPPSRSGMASAGGWAAGSLRKLSGSGEEAMSSCVYSCCGLWVSCSASPRSTIRPARMTRISSAK